MATADSVKRLWKVYNELKNELSVNDSSAKIFIDQTVEDELEVTAEELNNTGIKSGIHGKYMRIVGLIFPSTAPFRQLGLKVEMRVPAGYPLDPPVIYMRSDIRHPNKEKDGRMCTTLLDLARKWEQLSLFDVIKVVVKLIEEPERGHVVDAEMGSLYDADVNKYNEEIKKMVTQHGIQRPQP